MRTFGKKRAVAIAIVSIVIVSLISADFIINNLNIDNNSGDNGEDEDDDDVPNDEFIFNYIYYDNTSEFEFKEYNETALFTEKIAEINQWDDNYGIADNVVVVKDLAYVANHKSFLIINVSIPSKPIVLSDYYQGSSIPDVKVVNNLAYLANHMEGLVILNVSDPFNPIKIGQCKVNYPINTVDVQGNLAYLADPFMGDLYIINITTPSNPFLVSWCEDGGGWSLVVRGNYVYLVDRHSTAKIINVTDPFNPTILVDDSGSRRATGIHVVDDYLYIATGGSLAIYNISNPKAPQFINGTSVFDALDVFVLDGIAYMASGNDGLVVIDVSDPSNLVKIGQCGEEDGEAVGAFVVDDIAYIADYGSGLEIINVSNPHHPFEITHISEGGCSMDLSLHEDLIYIADEYGGLEIINISNPLALKKISNTHIHSYCLAVRNNQAHIVHFTEGYKIINVSNPYNPTLLSSYTDLAEYCYEHEIILKGNFTYITNENEGLLVLDVSNPLNIRKIAQLQIPDSETVGVRISGDYLFTVDQVSWYYPTYKISIYNNTDQLNPTYIGTYRSTSVVPYSIEIFDDIAFIMEVGNLFYDNPFPRISILNFSDPLQPFKIGEFGGFNYPKALEFSDNLVYIGDTGLRVYNISNFKNITLFGQFYNGGLGTLHDINYSNGLIYLADGMDNLEIVGFDNDDDTLANYVEINVYFTDPKDPDSDDDGIKDGQEILNGTDPNNPYDY